MKLIKKQKQLKYKWCSDLSKVTKWLLQSALDICDKCWLHVHPSVITNKWTAFAITRLLSHRCQIVFLSQVIISRGQIFIEVCNDKGICISHWSKVVYILQMAFSNTFSWIKNRRCIHCITRPPCDIRTILPNVSTMGLNLKSHFFRNKITYLYVLYILSAP